MEAALVENFSAREVNDLGEINIDFSAMRLEYSVQTCFIVTMLHLGCTCVTPASVELRIFWREILAGSLALDECSIGVL